MDPFPLQPGDVLQLSEAAPFPYSFLTVMAEKPGGAEGYVLLATTRGVLPTRTRLFVPFAQAEFIGSSCWDGEERLATHGMHKPALEGDVVQIAPSNDGFFGTAYMVVTEPKSFGAQGYIPMPDAPGEPPGLAFYRATWQEMEYIGRAIWVRAEGETDAL